MSHNQKNSDSASNDFDPSDGTKKHYKDQSSTKKLSAEEDYRGVSSKAARNNSGGDILGSSLSTNITPTCKVKMIRTLGLDDNLVEEPTHLYYERMVKAHHLSIQVPPRSPSPEPVQCKFCQHWGHDISFCSIMSLCIEFGISMEYDSEEEVKQDVPVVNLLDTVEGPKSEGNWN